MLRWIFCVGALLGLAGPLCAQVPLAAYNVDPAQVSVSGFSSGAFMAQQLGVAYSSHFMGVGVFAGYHYDCRRTQPQDACYGATLPDISGSRFNMDTWSGTLIEPVANIAHQRIYVFSGVYDDVVPQRAVNQVVNLYEVYAASTNIRYDNTILVGHVYPTDIDAAFDGAGISLQWFYGTLKPRNTGAPGGSLFLIDQGAFAPRGIGLDQVAWLYVPAGCAKGEPCKLHVFLHSCGTSYAQLGAPVWPDYSGHRMWADTNNIILLFPQVLPDAMHPEGCWDSNAWYGSDYDQKSGVQMTAIMGMVDKITSGYQPSPTVSNYQGLWWKSGGTESGWGVNFAHQGDQVFATWYTYDTAGKAWWLSMLANKTTGTTYAGDIFATAGPPFNSAPFPPVTATPTKVGTGTLTFTDANNGSFDYTLNGMPPHTKAITRYDLGTGPQPGCVYSGTTPNFVAATNYQDLWWVANGAESGWGVNFAHQGNSVFATWYTYGVDGTPLWLSALTTGVGNVYTGKLYRNSGPRFDAYDSTKVVLVEVGTATLTFADGNHATFDYVTNGSGGLPGVTQSKQITRFPFAATGGTLCQ